MGPWVGHLVFVKWGQTEDTPRTKLVAEADLCRRDKVATLEVRGNFPVSACKGRLLGGHNMPPHDK